ncbi:MAG: DNA-3-methyladenine glycosylase [Chlamydiota bacterium]
MDFKSTEEKLPLSFFRQQQTVEIAQQLLGKYLFTHFDGKITAGMITETEAYTGAEDRACHAYNNRRTKRTEALFAAGGIAYVYLCYGIHHLFNIVTHKENIPHAILIRSLKPTYGIETMLRRRKKNSVDKTLTRGPANTAQAVGIDTSHSGSDLTGNRIWLEDHGVIVAKSDILATPRIGIDYAGEDKNLPYRFLKL